MSICISPFSWLNFEIFSLFMVDSGIRELYMGMGSGGGLPLHPF